MPFYIEYITVFSNNTKIVSQKFGSNAVYKLYVN